eukprot:2940588-Prymnesium_polylepis.1
MRTKPVPKNRSGPCRWSADRSLQNRNRAELTNEVSDSVERHVNVENSRVSSIDTSDPSSVSALKANKGRAPAGGHTGRLPCTYPG